MSTEENAAAAPVSEAPAAAVTETTAAPPTAEVVAPVETAAPPAADVLMVDSSAAAVSASTAESTPPSASDSTSTSNLSNADAPVSPVPVAAAAVAAPVDDNAMTDVAEPVVSSTIAEAAPAAPAAAAASDSTTTSSPPSAALPATTEPSTTNENHTAAAASATTADATASTPAPAASTPAASPAPAATGATTTAPPPFVYDYDINKPRPHDVYLTPAQATVENKKLKAGCGWRFVAVTPIARPQLQLVDAIAAPRQPRRMTITKGPEQEELPPLEAPNKKARTSVTPITGASSDALPAKGPGRPAKRASVANAAAASEEDAVVDEKARQLQELEAKIQALKEQAQQLTAPTTPSAAAAAPPAESKKRKSTAPPSVSIPATPAFSRATSQAQTPATPGVSRTGRQVKAPQLFANEADSNVEMKQLKKARVLLEHILNNKRAKGIFNAPVNYTDPNKLYYAQGYLEAIGADSYPMDLGTIRSKLHGNEYSTLNEFARDMRVTFNNAMRYNPPGVWIHDAAKECLHVFEKEIDRIENGSEKKSADKRPRSSSVHEDYDDYEREDKRAKKRTKREEELTRLQSQMPSMNNAQVDLMEKMAARIMALEAKLSASEGNHSAPSKAAPASAYKPTPPAAPAAASAAKKQPAPSPVAAVKTLQPLTQREKQQLKDDIFKLPSHKLGPVVEIISKAMPKTAQDDSDEIEIDIDKLDIPTLRDLQAYVRKALAAMKRNTKPTPVPRRATPATGGPRASPAGASPFPRTSPAAATMQSPQRLETPSTPSMQRQGSQAPGSTPAINYGSSSDDDSSSDSDSSDDDAGYSTHVGAATFDQASKPAAAAVDDDAAIAAAWGKSTTAASTPASATPNASNGTSALWSDFQRSAQEAKEKSAQLAELERARNAQLEVDKAELIRASQQRKIDEAEEEKARAEEEIRVSNEKASKLAADREAARVAREARLKEGEQGVASRFGMEE